MPKKVGNINRSVLTNAPLPTATSTYTVISHSSVINTIHQTLHQHGFNVIEEIYSANHQAQVARGTFKLDYQNDPEMSLMFSFVNSYDKSKRFQCCLGAIAEINQSYFMYDISKWDRKHTGTADQELVDTIEDQVKQAKQHYDNLKLHKDLMQQTTITKKEFATIIGELYLENIISSDQISIIRREFKKPSFQYTAGNDNLWSCYMYIISAVGETHPKKWMETQTYIHMYIMNKFDLLTFDQPVVEQPETIEIELTDNMSVSEVINHNNGATYVFQDYSEDGTTLIYKIVTEEPVEETTEEELNVNFEEFPETAQETIQETITEVVTKDVTEDTVEIDAEVVTIINPSPQSIPQPSPIQESPQSSSQESIETKPVENKEKQLIINGEAVTPLPGILDDVEEFPLLPGFDTLVETTEESVVESMEGQTNLLDAIAEEESKLVERPAETDDFGAFRRIASVTIVEEASEVVQDLDAEEDEDWADMIPVATEEELNHQLHGVDNNEATLTGTAQYLKEDREEGLTMPSEDVIPQPAKTPEEKYEEEQREQAELYHSEIIEEILDNTPPEQAQELEMGMVAVAKSGGDYDIDNVYLPIAEYSIMEIGDILDLGEHNVEIVDEIVIDGVEMWKCVVVKIEETTETPVEETSEKIEVQEETSEVKPDDVFLQKPLEKQEAQQASIEDLKPVVDKSNPVYKAIAKEVQDIYEHDLEFTYTLEDGQYNIVLETEETMTLSVSYVNTLM